MYRAVCGKTIGSRRSLAALGITMRFVQIPRGTVCVYQRNDYDPPTLDPRDSEARHQS
jgi:hypothetical protein